MCTQAAEGTGSVWYMAPRRKDGDGALAKRERAQSCAVPLRELGEL